MQTPWYIKQLKNQASRESLPLPFSMDDSAIDRIEAVRWEPRDISLPVNTDALTQSTEMSQSLVSTQEGTAQLQSPMTWQLTGRQFGHDLFALYPNDLAVLDIVQTNAREDWKRPVYFAVTVSPDGQLDCQNYFQLEGQAYRVVPIRHDERQGRVVPGITDANLLNFRFRGLDRSRRVLRRDWPIIHSGRLGPQTATCSPGLRSRSSRWATRCASARSWA